MDISLISDPFASTLVIPNLHHSYLVCIVYVYVPFLVIIIRYGLTHCLHI